MPALIAEVFGDAGGVGCALQTHQRADVGRGGDDDGAAQAFFAENLLDELLDLAAPFADQPDDDDLGLGIARHHAEQNALADAGAGEKPMRWPRPTVSRALMARTPTSSACSIGARDIGLTGRLCSGRSDLGHAPGRACRAAGRRHRDAAEQPFADRQQLGAIDRAPRRAAWPILRAAGLGFHGDDPAPGERP
jgi:hypothetical protein